MEFEYLQATGMVMVCGYFKVSQATELVSQATELEFEWLQVSQATVLEFQYLKVSQATRLEFEYLKLRS